MGEAGATSGECRLAHASSGIFRINFDFRAPSFELSTTSNPEVQRSSAFAAVRHGSIPAASCRSTKASYKNK